MASTTNWKQNNQRADSGNWTVVSGMDSSEAKFTWELKNFHHLKAADKEVINAQKFELTIHAGESGLLPTNWRVWLEGDTVDGKEWIGIHHQLVKDVGIPIHTTFQVAVRNPTGRGYFFKERTDLHLMTDPDISWDGYGILKFIENSLPDSSLPLVNNSLFIEGVINVLTERVPEGNEHPNFGLARKKATSKLVNDLGTFCGSGHGLGAVTLVSAEGKQHFSNKFILSVRSPVFATMFTAGLVEDEARAVEIPDCSSKTLEVMLSYIHNGNFLETEFTTRENIYNVAYAAEKYELSDLKQVCDGALLLKWDRSRPTEELESAKKFGLTRSANLISEYIQRHFGDDDSPQKRRKVVRDNSQ